MYMGDSDRFGWTQQCLARRQGTAIEDTSMQTRIFVRALSLQFGAAVPNARGSFGEIDCEGGLQGLVSGECKSFNQVVAGSIPARPTRHRSVA